MEQKVVEKRNSLVWPVVIIIILLLIIVLVIYYLRFAVFIAPKADTNNIYNSISVNNSYIFASPVRAKANGDLIRVTVFLLDDKGVGLFDKKVQLNYNGTELDVKEIQSLTDETGKAIFDVAGLKSGTYYLDALSENITLPQRVKLVYY